MRRSPRTQRAFAATTAANLAAHRARMAAVPSSCDGRRSGHATPPWETYLAVHREHDVAGPHNLAQPLVRAARPPPATARDTRRRRRRATDTLTFMRSSRWRRYTSPDVSLNLLLLLALVVDCHCRGDRLIVMYLPSTTRQP